MSKERARERHLKARYNITSAEYEKILAYQGGCCAICKRGAGHFNTRLAVEHDHGSRMLRGLACWSCNSLMPNRRDLGGLLRCVVQYLENPPAVAALGGPRYANPIRRKRRKR